MSKSVHITKKNFKSLTKAELDEQAQDSNSDLNNWAKKSSLKKSSKRIGKIKRENNLNDLF